MKIKVTKKDFDEVMKIPRPKREKPVKQSLFWRFLMKTLSARDLKKANFRAEYKGMERLEKDEPCLYLMNHSSFIDLEIASTVIYPSQFHIICTLDGFVGKDAMMRRIGCIPAKKFINDTSMVRDAHYAVKELGSSILLYPEASYSFDGTATPLPESIGKFVKLLGIPVVMIRTYGAFSRDPLYNGLKVRNVDVSCDVEYIMSKEDIETKTASQINDEISSKFDFDNFRWQQDNGIVVNEPFRADGLNRVLYKCPHCLAEGETLGKGTTLMCSCGASYELTEFGSLKYLGGGSEPVKNFDHIPDWFRWQRECVRKELEDGSYSMELDVGICILADTKSIYDVGEGVLKHDKEGFSLKGCEGRLEYNLHPKNSYSLYSDYFWYEIGDMISIGDTKLQYYCFPKNKNANVAKARLATEELFKMMKNKK